MRINLIIILATLIGCNASNTDTASYWNRAKQQFRYRSKSEFAIDSELKSDLTSLRKVALDLNPRIDSVYLYSWQGSYNGNSRFTVVVKEGIFGPRIFYVITDKKDRVISSTKIAGVDDEGDEWTPFGAQFFAPDSFNITFPKGNPSYSVLHSIEKNGDITVILDTLQ